MLRLIAGVLPLLLVPTLLVLAEVRSGSTSTTSPSQPAAVQQSKGDTWFTETFKKDMSPMMVDSWNVDILGVQESNAIVAVCVKDGLAYCGIGGFLVVLDISDPIQPHKLSNYLVDGSIRDVYVADQRVYICTESGNYIIVDVSDPLEPAEDGSYLFGHKILASSVADEHAYIACDDEGLRVLDISNPSDPLEVGSWNPTDHLVSDVVVDSTFAYLTGTVYGQSYNLWVLDVTNPDSLNLVGGNSLEDYVFDIKIDGARAYVPDRSNGLKVFNISDPTNPTYVGAFDEPGNRAFYVDASGPYAYVGGDYSPKPGQQLPCLFVVEVSSLVGVDTLSLPDPENPGYYVQGVAYSENHAFVAQGGSGLKVIDVSTPANTEQVGLYAPGFGYLDVEASGDYLFLAANTSGLKVLDVSSPTRPQIVGGHDTNGSVSGIRLTGTNAYLADGYGLKIFDVSDPTAPVLLGSFPTRGWQIMANHVDASGTYAYVTEVHLDYWYYPVYSYEGSGLRVVDVTDPANPIEAGFYAPPRFGCI